MPFDDTPACASKPDLPFIADDIRLPRPQRIAAARECRALCLRCPDRVECLAQGIEAQVHGMWGGTTTYDRRKIRQRFRIVPVVLGLTSDEQPDHARALRAASRHIHDELERERVRMMEAARRAERRQQAS